MWDIADRFVVVQTLGSGGMGSVYLCEDHKAGSETEYARTNRLVAVKVLDKTSEESGSATHLRALTHEFKMLRLISNDHIIRVHDFDVWTRDGRKTFWYSMEHVVGNHLVDPYATSEGNRYPYRLADYEEFGEIICQICKGLLVIHFHGRIHGDVKPQNIIVRRLIRLRKELTGWRRWGSPCAVILDFGLSGKVKARKTTLFQGTPFYAAPETIPGGEIVLGDRAQVRRIDQRADLYSLGCVLYDVLAGRPPYVEDSAERVLTLHLDPTRRPRPLPQQSPALPGQPIPGVLQELTLSLMRSDPAGRPPSCEEVIRIIEKELLRRPVSIDLDSSVSYGTAIHYVDTENLVARATSEILRAFDPGAKGLVWINEPDGMGKRRLLKEAKARVLDEGIQYVKVNGTDPSFSRLFRKLAELLPDQEQPGFRQRYPLLMEASSTAGEESRVPGPGSGLIDAVVRRERKELVESLTSAIRDITNRGRRILVAYEGVEYADHDVVFVLLESASRLRGEGAAFVLSGVFERAQPDVAKLLTDRLEVGAIPRLRLTPFDERRTEEYLHAVLRAEPSSELVGHALETSKGCPGILVGFVKSMLQSEALVFEEGEHRVVRLKYRPGKAIGLAQDLAQPLTRAVRAAAAVGHVVSSKEVAQVLETEQAEAEQALDELAARGLVERHERGIYRISRAHAEAVLDAIPPRDRTRLHRQIASALEKSTHPRASQERVRHLQAAGALKEAAEAALLVAKAEQGKPAPHISLALEMLSIAIDILREQGKKRTRAQTSMLYEALLLRGEWQAQREEPHGARASYEEALDVAKDLDEIERGRALTLLGKALGNEESAKQDAAAQERFAEAWRIAGKGTTEDHLDLQELVLTEHGRLARRRERFGAALELFRQLAELRQKRGKPTYEVLFEIGYCEVRANVDREGGVKKIDGAIEEAQRAGKDAVVAEAHQRYGRALMELDRLKAAKDHLEKALEFFRSRGLRTKENLALANLTLLTSHLGPFVDTVAMADEVIKRRSKGDDIAAMVRLHKAQVLHYQALYLQALEVTRGAQSIPARQNDALILEARILAELNLKEAAKEALNRVDANTGSSEGKTESRRWTDLQHLALTMVEEGRMRLSWLRGTGTRQEYGELVEQLRPASEVALKVKQAILVAQADAALAEAMAHAEPGRGEDARRVVNAALESVWRTDAPCYILQVVYHAAMVERVLGNRSQAVTHVDFVIHKRPVWPWQDEAYWWRTLALKGDLEFEVKSYDRARDAYGRAFEVIERVMRDLMRQGELGIRLLGKMEEERADPVAFGRKLGGGFVSQPLAAEVLSRTRYLLNG